VKYFWTRYLPSYHASLVYMLQLTEYQPKSYLHWLHRSRDFRRIMYRQTLDRTTKAKTLLFVLRLISLLMLILTVWLTVFAIKELQPVYFIVSIVLIVSYPFVLAYGLLIALYIGYVAVQQPKQKRLKRSAAGKLAKHPAAHRIAIVGSYGKTTAKEILKAVLGQTYNVAATPGNMNTEIGISRFIMSLSGEEEVLIFEYGEEEVGDISRLADFTKPSLAIITGASAAHMDTFGSLENVVATLREIEANVPADKIYVNADSPLLEDIGELTRRYSQLGIGAWQTHQIKFSLNGTSFILKNKVKSLSINTKLIGNHLVGVCSAVSTVALSLGMKPKDIESAFKKVKPFEHRMQPYELHGATIIDDTYNGNIEGMKAGLKLLKQAQSVGRKIYITPGLVEQGSLEQSIHIDLGVQIAQVADVVVLMQNSVTPYILKGLDRADFSGELLCVDSPLEFYQNLDKFILKNDVVLMQNDWTDNYS
jgi:UDP-N-acetylmuramoyl-tripeptide--D-alanyl-D-alanine ligase